MHGVSVVNRDHRKDEFRSKLKITIGSALVLGACFGAYVPLKDRYNSAPNRSRYELVRDSDSTIRRLVSSLSERSIYSLDAQNPNSEFGRNLTKVKSNLTSAGYSSLASAAYTCPSNDSSATSNCLTRVSNSTGRELRTTFSRPHNLDSFSSFLLSIASVAGLFFAFGSLGIISDRLPPKPSEKYKSRMDGV